MIIIVGLTSPTTSITALIPATRVAGQRLYPSMPSWSDLPTGYVPNSSVNRRQKGGTRIKFRRQALATVVRLITSTFRCLRLHSTWTVMYPHPKAARTPQTDVILVIEFLQLRQHALRRIGVQRPNDTLNSLLISFQETGRSSLRQNRCSLPTMSTLNHTKRSIAKRLKSGILRGELQRKFAVMSKCFK